MHYPFATRPKEINLFERLSFRLAAVKNDEPGPLHASAPSGRRTPREARSLAASARSLPTPSPPLAGQACPARRAALMPRAGACLVNSRSHVGPHQNSSRFASRWVRGSDWGTLRLGVGFRFGLRLGCMSIGLFLVSDLFCREAGARATNVFLRDLNLGMPLSDGRRLEIVVNGLPRCPRHNTHQPARRDRSVAPAASASTTLERTHSPAHGTFSPCTTAPCSFTGFALFGRQKRSRNHWHLIEAHC